MNRWTRVANKLPPEGVEVRTNIGGATACNETTLVRKGNLWFYPDMSMYVHYRPTHYMLIERGE